MRDSEIINIALENLQKNAHIKGEWKDIAPKNGIDGTITFNIDNQKVEIFAEVKKALRNHHLQQITAIAENYKPFLLVTDHIFPKIKDELRERHIAYLEANGNIYLKEPGIFLWIDNQKPVQAEKERVDRAFKKTGLRVIFLFLLDEKFVNAPYREIAAKAGVALGNVNYVMNDLRQAGFLIKVNKDEYKLMNKKELLTKWMEAFDERLKPTLQVGTFRFLKEEDFKKWKLLPLTTGKTFWGGEPGGALFTNYLRPEILTLYTEESRVEIIKNYRLVPDENGNVKVYKKFWQYDDVKWDTVPPALIYADLMNTGDGRCMETAIMVYDEYLYKIFDNRT